MDVGDGDLVRLARDGNPVAFRLLVERHQPMARARAARLCANPSDVDDVVQESLLQAYVALDRLREPDRFAGWLAGIVLNVCRRLHRRSPLVLLPDWPEPLHPAADRGLPSAEDLDRADAVRAALAGLPAGQRRTAALHYYADLPPGQIAETAGAARASLHKARHALRAYLTAHRPDLIPAASRRTHMTTVRIARAERRIPPGQPLPTSAPSHVIVLADDAGQRELPIWLLGVDGHRLSRLVDRAGHGGQAGTLAETADELTSELLRAAGAGVRGVDIDDLGPELAAARIEVAGPGPGRTRHVAARLPDGLAVAITAGAPVRVADTVLERLAGRTPAPGMPAMPARAHDRPRYEPRNLAFADGLEGWMFGGSFAEHASEAHWHDYAITAGHGSAVIASAVPEPAGFALLGQEVFADDYRDEVVVFRGEFRTGDAARAGLFLRAGRGRDVLGPLTEKAILDDPGHHTVTIPGGPGWAVREVTARVPGNSDTFTFGMFLAGRGRIELRHAELIRGG